MTFRFLPQSRTLYYSDFLNAFMFCLWKFGLPSIVARPVLSAQQQKYQVFSDVLLMGISSENPEIEGIKWE